MKKTIAIDIDEVLSASATGFMAFSNKRWGTNLSITDYHEHWASMWQVSEEEADRRLVTLNKELVIRSYEPFSDAFAVLSVLAKKYRLLIATSRNTLLSEDTTVWLDKHFKGIFENIHHSGIYDTTSEVRHLLTKAQLCADIGADYLIDDQLKHCFGASEIGVKALVFGAYAWNKADTLPANCTRCATWNDVLEYFQKQSESHK